MPAAMVKSFAQKTGLSVSDVEKKWEKSKELVKKEYPKIKENSDRFFALTVGILKRMLKMKEQITTSNIGNMGPGPRGKLFRREVRREKKKKKHKPVMIYDPPLNNVSGEGEEINFKKYLKESLSKEETYDNINNVNDVKHLMKKFKDNKVRTVSVVFGQAIVKVYDSPSKIKYNDVGSSPIGLEGYWKNGELIKFSSKLKIKYQNTALGRG